MMRILTTRRLLIPSLEQASILHSSLPVFLNILADNSGDVW